MVGNAKPVASPYLATQLKQSSRASTTKTKTKTKKRG